MIFDEIVNAQSGDHTSQLVIIKKFKPILKKYGQKLKFEEGIKDGY